MDNLIVNRRKILLNAPHKVSVSGRSVLVRVSEPNVERLAVKFSPIQIGSGTPSPSNVRLIMGHNSAMASIGTTPYSISFGGTYIGGVVELVSGVLTVTMVVESHKWGTGYVSQQETGDYLMRVWTLGNETTDLAVKGNSLCSIAPWDAVYDAQNTHYHTAGNSLYVVLPVGTSDNLSFTHAYDLAEPQTVQLTPQTITALRGQQTATTPDDLVYITYWTH